MYIYIFYVYNNHLMREMCSRVHNIGEKIVTYQNIILKKKITRHQTRKSIRINLINFFFFLFEYCFDFFFQKKNSYKYMF